MEDVEKTFQVKGVVKMKWEEVINAKKRDKGEVVDQFSVSEKAILEANKDIFTKLLDSPLLDAIGGHAHAKQILLKRHVRNRQNPEASERSYAITGVNQKHIRLAQASVYTMIEHANFLNDEKKGLFGMSIAEKVARLNRTDLIKNTVYGLRCVSTHQREPKGFNSVICTAEEYIQLDSFLHL